MDDESIYGPGGGYGEGGGGSDSDGMDEIDYSSKSNSSRDVSSEEDNYGEDSPKKQDNYADLGRASLGGTSKRGREVSASERAIENLTTLIRDSDLYSSITPKKIEDIKDTFGQRIHLFHIKTFASACEWKNTKNTIDPKDDKKISAFCEARGVDQADFIRYFLVL